MSRRKDLRYVPHTPVDWSVMRTPDFAFEAEAGAGAVRFVGQHPDWPEERLLDVLHGEAQAAQSKQRAGVQLPRHSEDLALSAFGRPAYQTRRNEGGRNHWATQSFSLLAVANSRASEVAGILNFDVTVTWPSERGLQPDRLWNDPPEPLGLCLNLGGIWMRPAFRSEGWTSAIATLYSHIQQHELAQLAQVFREEPSPFGRRHRVQVSHAACYWSRAGQRMGQQLIRTLRAEARAWSADERQRFQLTLLPAPV